MLRTLKEKINNSKISSNPFPHFIIKNFLPNEKLKKLNQVLPNYDDINEENVIFQSSSKTKKTVMPDSKIFKELEKIKIFKEINDNLKRIQPFILKKFKKEIIKNVNPRYLRSPIKYNMNFAMMKKGYLKSPHLDRRDHLISGIYYPTSKENQGGHLQMFKSKKKNTYDVFPSKKELKISKNYKIRENFCVFFLNVPWAYHGVSKYNGKTDRKYFYIDYDFKSKISSSKSKNRAKGFNQNPYWEQLVSVKNANRKKKFFTE
tara:strand:+ start:1339 stop:2121 length:783 start_codon:yes stop_codon:yes gene_type:complete